MKGYNIMARVMATQLLFYCNLLFPLLLLILIMLSKGSFLYTFLYHLKSRVAVVNHANNCTLGSIHAFTHLMPGFKSLWQNTCNKLFLFHSQFNFIHSVVNYATSTSGEAYRDRQLTPNFEL